MYCILMDAKTKSFYMDPGDVLFHAYSDASKLDIKRKSSRLVETEFEEEKELATFLYNAGFFGGYIDGKEFRITKDKVYYFDRNPNEIVYAQYLLTKDKKYLELIKKTKLVTLCKTDGETIMFPSVLLEDGTRAVLAYTNRNRIPTNLFEKYDGWTCVKMSFDTKCIVNSEFVLE